MIKIKGDDVVIYNEEDGREEYWFKLHRANEKYADTNYSDWIIHLASKTWSTMPMLIELANILKKEAPKIDWQGSIRFARDIKR